MVWQRGESGNPSGRKRGEVFVSEAVRALLRGDSPPENAAPVWTVARSVLDALTGERIDARILSLVLERLEGKVPDKLTLDVQAGVVLLPAERLTGQAWADLVAAETGTARRLVGAPTEDTLDAELVPPPDGSDGGADGGA